MQVLKQTLRADNIWKINEILDIASECLITNVNFDVAKDYVPYAVEFNTEDMLTDVLPGTNTNKNTSGTWIFVHDKQKTKKLVQELFYHRDVSENGEEISLSKLNILILNGDNSPPRPINDTINDITYIAIFLSSKTFANILNFFIFVFP